MPASRSFTVQAQAGERRREETKKDLIDATRRLLASGAPLATLSIERIVAEAGVVRTTFYLHFKNKYDLLEGLAAEQQAWLETIGWAASEDTELTWHTLRHAIGRIVDQWADNHAVIAAIIELGRYDPRMSALWGRTMQATAAVAGRIFEAHWHAQNTSPDSPEVVAEVLTWMIERSCDQLAADPGRRGPVADALTEVIWRTLHPDTRQLEKRTGTTTS